MAAAFCHIAPNQSREKTNGGQCPPYEKKAAAKEEQVNR
jgi:hypothetical protein